jgi:hypothetical protein
MFISNNNVYSSLLSAVCLLKIWSRDSNSGKGYEIFLFLETPRTALRSIQPSIQRLPAAKRRGIMAEHSSSSSVELKMTSLPYLCNFIVIPLLYYWLFICTYVNMEYHGHWASGCVTAAGLLIGRY